MDDVDVRVRFEISHWAAATISVSPDVAGSAEACTDLVRQWMSEGDLRYEIYSTSVEPMGVYRLTDPCRVREPGVETPWCSVHDSPMKTKRKCYEAPKDGKPAEYGR